jgi:methionyl-tRNA formyltransferase
MLETLRRLADGTAVETSQDESQATRAIKLNRDLSKIDWSKPADVVARQVRGMYPWPGCRVRLIHPEGRDLAHLTLVRARPASTSTGAAAPGTVLADRTVASGTGAIEVVEVQPEGKRPMSLTAYRNGHPWEPGMRLESLA